MHFKEHNTYFTMFTSLFFYHVLVLRHNNQSETGTEKCAGNSKSQLSYLRRPGRPSTIGYAAGVTFSFKMLRTTYRSTTNEDNQGPRKEYPYFEGKCLFFSFTHEPLAPYFLSLKNVLFLLWLNACSMHLTRRIHSFTHANSV